MVGMTNRGKTQLLLSIAIFTECLVIGLHSLHLISTAWTVIAFFAVVIPFGTIQAFSNSRNR